MHPDWLVAARAILERNELLARQSDQPAQGVAVDSVEHLAFMLANEVIEGTEPHHKRETAFLLLKALRAAPATQPVAPGEVDACFARLSAFAPKPVQPTEHVSIPPPIVR